MPWLESQGRGHECVRRTDHTFKAEETNTGRTAPTQQRSEERGLS